MWFQQYGATAHVDRRSMDMLRENVSKASNLTTMRHPVAGTSSEHRKAEVFKHKPRSTDDLKTAVRQKSLRYHNK